MPTVPESIYAEALDYLDYCPETGVFRWKVARGNAVPAGSIAGTVNEKGYVIINIKGRALSGHRLSFFAIHRYLPDMVDHIDRVRHNNRISNLRASNAYKNAQNRSPIGKSPQKLKKLNRPLKVSGVYQEGNKWVACVGFKGETKTFSCFEEAVAAREAFVQKFLQE